MKITHHKNGEIKTLVDEAPYHPGYEDVGFKSKVVNNEPIAFVTGVRQFDTKYTGTVLKVGTPLYAHPVQKPIMVLDGNRVYPTDEKQSKYEQGNKANLTDEEILNLWVQKTN